jgi:hypothetical protein
MHTQRQHLRIIFLFVSEQDVLCGACGCPEPRQDMSAEFCPNHQWEIQEFQRWLVELSGSDAAHAASARG